MKVLSQISSILVVAMMLTVAGAFVTGCRGGASSGGRAGTTTAVKEQIPEYDMAGLKKAVEIFDEVGPFNDGRSKVGNIITGFGYIDPTGRVAIPIIYKDASDFSGGVARVKAEKGWTYIDTKGRAVIKGEFASIGAFCDGVCTVMDESMRCAVAGAKGMVVDFGTYAKIDNFSEGLAVVRTKDGKTGVIDTKGTYTELLIPERLTVGWGRAFHDGRIVVEGYNDDTRCAVLDKGGKIYSEGKYLVINNFHNSLAKVSLDGVKWGMIDAGGEEVLQCVHDELFDCEDGMVRFCRHDPKGGKLYGFADSTGKVVIPAQYSFAADFSEGRATVGLDGRYGVVDKEGNMVVPIMYNNIIGKFVEGRAYVQSDGLWGYVDKTGEVVVPCSYSVVENFHNGLARVKVKKDDRIFEKGFLIM